MLLGDLGGFGPTPTLPPAPPPLPQPPVGPPPDLGASGAEQAAAEDTKPDIDAMVGTAVRWAAGDTGHEKADFQKVSNKFAIAIVPSFNMGMRGQQEPSSGLWFRSLGASDQMYCQFSIVGSSGGVDALCREEIKDRHGQDSLSQLEYLTRHRLLPDAMRFGGTMLPTSLWIIAHGMPGHVKIGKQLIPVLEFVRLIKEWTNRSGYLQHVHIEACSALQGVTTDDKKRIKSIKDVMITGYDQKVGTCGVDIAQRFGVQLMHALSTEVAQLGPGAWEELHSERLWANVKLQLQGQVGQAHRGEEAGSSEAETFKAFKVI